jgi:hypothetical protein
MTGAEFVALHKRLNLSRSAFCKQLGISENSGTAYALGRAPIPLTVAMACSALAMGMPPYGEAS